MKTVLDRFLFGSLLDEGEKIVYVAHIHPFIVYPILFKSTFFGLLIPALGYWIFPMMPAVWLAWVILGGMICFYRLTQWYMDAWIVTNMSVINFEWNSPFSKSTNRIEFGTIETTTSEIHGFWGTLFRFGNLQIDNVASNPIVLKNVALPQKVERIIMENQSKFVHHQAVRDHGQLKELLTTLLRSNIKNG
ncbi:hypothetical protein IPG41_00850 [Candidatus Peregrinibacteria bacterium]|nr:MAG: hypothetical protein IPG41_00850 [Candidatus Peregrinibacteria bacterium]